MKRLTPILVTLALMVCMASVAFARGGPPGERAVTSKVAVETVAPLAPVSAQVGYDVVQISNDSSALKATAVSDSAYVGKRGLSTTVGWRSGDIRNASSNGRPEPAIVLLA